MAQFSESDIINELCNAQLKNKYFYFPIYEEFDYPMSFNRINLFGDDKRWVIAFERTIYSPSGGYFENEITYYGNCLELINKYNSVHFYNVITPDEVERIRLDYDGLIKANIDSVIVRGQQLPINHNVEDYKKKGIKVDYYENPDNLIDFKSFLRFMTIEYPDLFCATEEEIKEYIPKDLPKIMSIDEWHHRNYYGSERYPIAEEGTKPSDYETYPMIAKILVTKDISLWKPTLNPNNHWSNWREGYE